MRDGKVLDRIDAPWTMAQVVSLNRFQHFGYMHPFTCGQEECRALLVATTEGWLCPVIACGYKQNWAWAFMAEELPIVHFRSPHVVQLPDGWGEKLAHLICPQCHKPFVLTWQDEITKTVNSGEKSTLGIRSCPSGGVYDVSIRCPHCDYEEPL